MNEVQLGWQPRIKGIHWINFGLAKVIGLLLICLSSTSWSSTTSIAPDAVHATLIIDQQSGKSHEAFNQVPTLQPFAVLQPFAMQVEGKHLAMDVGRFFDISHFYQPNIRNDVLVDKSALDVPRHSTSQQYHAYLGVAGSRLQYRAENNLEYSLSGYEIQVGARTNDYFGLEFRLGKSNESESKNSFGDHSTLELDHMISMFARPSFALSDDLRVQAVIGYSSIKRTISGQPALRQRDSREKSGLSYGLGLQWQWCSNYSLSIDYLNLYDDGDESLDGINVGISIIHR